MHDTKSRAIVLAGNQTYRSVIDDHKIYLLPQ